MTDHLIFAPHVDDEVIGCWSLLEQAQASKLVVYCSIPSKERRLEAQWAAEKLGFTFAVLKKERSLSALILAAVQSVPKNGVCWAPDPQWEWHPLHKVVGTLVREACTHTQTRYGTYSTNMNVPYLKTLTARESYHKRDVLDNCYPSQQSLWCTDHRYFLFEGRVEWNPPA